MNSFQTDWMPRGPIEQRATPRLAVAIPAAINVGAQDFGARILNLATGGAMVETSAPVLLNSALTLRCGTIVAGAVVAWRNAERIGIRFHDPLTEAQVHEQVSRSTALASRRLRREPSSF